MLGCEVIFGAESVRVRELIEEATGQDCPCVQGRTCPLMPAEAHADDPPVSMSA